MNSKVMVIACLLSMGLFQLCSAYDPFKPTAKPALNADVSAVTITVNAPAGSEIHVNRS